MRVEVVDPELVEVTKDNEWRALRNDVGPVIENLVVMLLEILAARFHLYEDTVRPEKVGEFFAAFRPQSRAIALDQLQLGRARLLGDAKLEGRASLDSSRMTESTKEMVEEGLGFALFVAAERLGEPNELSKALL